jgi:hypothetical protein
MTSSSIQVSEWIDRPAADVYEYVRRPANLAEWAPGLGAGVRQVDGRWFVETPDGLVGVEFAPRNDFGVLDHDVTFPSGQTYYNPMRVTACDGGSEVVFSVRRLPGTSEQEHARDAGLVAADLARLKLVLEATWTST